MEEFWKIEFFAEHGEMMHENPQFFVHSARPGDGQLETSGDSLEDDSGLLLRELAMFLSGTY